MPVNLTIVNTKCNAARDALNEMLIGGAEQISQVDPDGRATSIRSDIARANDLIENIRESFRSHVYNR